LILNLRSVFIGYGTDSYGYRMWDMEKQKTVRSMDVVFNESIMYKDRQVRENEMVKEPDFVEFEISSMDVVKPLDDNTHKTSQEDLKKTPTLRRSTSH
jgi:hypothetical protein